MKLVHLTAVTLALLISVAVGRNSSAYSVPAPAPVFGPALPPGPAVLPAAPDITPGPRPTARCFKETQTDCTAIGCADVGIFKILCERSAGGTKAGCVGNSPHYCSNGTECKQNQGTGTCP